MSVTPSAAGRSAPGRPDADRGAVAIIVAICTASFLLGVGALAVDLGNAYSRQGDLQASAERAALAAGNVLLLDTSGSKMSNAVSAAVEALCSPTDNPVVEGWPAGTCTSPYTWTSDGTTANGEIEFVTEDANRNGIFDAGTEVTSGPATTGVRVLPPPARVDFGLAAALGKSSVQVGAAATAALTTPDAAQRMLPFFLVSDDLPGPGRSGNVCLLRSGSDWAGAGICKRRPFVNETPTSNLTPRLQELLRSGVGPQLHDFLRWRCSSSTDSSPTPGCITPPASLDAACPGGAGVNTGTDLNCIDVANSFGGSEGLQLRRGFLRGVGTGRLQEQDCGGSRGYSHSRADVDLNTLLQSGGPWLFAPLTAAEVTQVQTAIAAGATNPLSRPVFNAKIFECPRFGIVPVVNATSLPLASNNQVVVGFRYLWVGSDDEVESLTNGCTETDNGLMWDHDLDAFSGTGCDSFDNGDLDGVKGYVFDKSYLPEQPQAYTRSAPYLGPDLAGAVVLTRDRDDP